MIINTLCRKHLVLLLCLITIFGSCSEENDPIVENSTLSITFNITNDLENGKVENSIDDATKIVISIQHANGTDTEYVSKKMDFFKLEGSYISGKINLPVGNYKVTEFLLVDNNNNVMFVTPVKGSQQAQNIQNPLPIDFEIIKDELTEVNMEVLAINNLTPEDFGLVSFNIHLIETFAFLANVSEKGEGLLEAEISVSGNEYIYSQSLERIAANIVTVKADLDVYVITVAKEGYITFEYPYSKDSLFSYADTPLSIELEKEDSNFDTVTDYDGNVYHELTIGDQIWLGSNLRSEHYCDGFEIEFHKYQNNDSIADIYGYLYKWEASTRNQSGSMIQGACPCDWHIPSKDEWLELAVYLGWADAGGKLKAAGLTYWDAPNEGATDEYGFKALPAGQGDPGVNLGYTATFATSSYDYNYDPTGNYVHEIGLTAAHSIMWIGNNTKAASTSIRCIKN